MRKVPVLTMVSLVAIAGLMAVPVHAGTVVANDTPDFNLAVGSPSTIDLADFFDTEGPDALSYSASGSATVNDAATGATTINNSGVVGTTSASFTGTAGADSATVESQVHVSSFIIGNGPAIDNNNRWAGVAGGNIFYNGIVPGQSVNSVVNLSNIPAGGTHGGGTHGGAALVASIASSNWTVASTGLRQVTRTVANEGAGTASSGGLTATLNADGSYSLATTSSFSGAWVVSLGASDGTSTSGVHMLAAAAQAVSTAAAADFIDIQVNDTASKATTAYAASGITISGGAGSSALIIKSAGLSVAAGQAVTISADYNSNVADINLALLAFDGAIGTSVSYTQKIGATNLQAGAVKNIAFTMVSQTGTVLPGVQVVATSAGTSVTVSNIKVIAAGTVADYAFDPNAKAYDNDLSSIAGFSPVGSGVAPGASTENHYVSANGSGSMLLDGVTNPISNALTAVSVGPGSVIAECYAKRSGAAGAGSAVALVVTGDGASNDASFTEGTLISDTDWSKLTATGTYSTTANMFLVVQAAGVNVSVDDLVIRKVADPAGATDLSLLGL
jgi:hypothetical protein